MEIDDANTLMYYTRYSEQRTTTKCRIVYKLMYSISVSFYSDDIEKRILSLTGGPDINLIRSVSLMVFTTS